MKNIWRAFFMDRERILAKLDEMDRYLGELDSVVPENFEDYRANVTAKRACERLLHIIIETVVDVCAVMVKGLRLGVPGDEEAFFEKLSGVVIRKETAEKLREMKGFRNVLVHRYAEVDDARVYDILKTSLGDFDGFKNEVLDFLKKEGMK
jgi:uncharacterized protein YutE (UPF0331/DUF86 family)